MTEGREGEAISAGWTIEFATSRQLDYLKSDETGRTTALFFDNEITFNRRLSVY